MSKQHLLPRASGRLIAAGARHVSLHRPSARACAEFVLGRQKEGKLSAEALFHRTAVQPKEADVEGVNWVFFANAINFSFWNNDDEPKYEVTYEGITYNGYLSLCAAIKRTLDRGITLVNPDFYGNLTLEELNGYLMGDHDVPCPLVDLRLNCLKEVSGVLKDKYGGSVHALVAKAEGSAQKLLALVTNDFPCFRDVAEFNGAAVSLHKRAQIFVADLASLSEGGGPGRFDDIDSLTMFADYRVPQSLQYFGVFKYSEALLAKLNSDELLPNGSEFEVEIRGCSIAAVEMIMEEVRKLSPDTKINDILVDYFLWAFRREKAEEMQKFPFHKTRSIFY